MQYVGSDVAGLHVVNAVVDVCHCARYSHPVSKLLHKLCNVMGHLNRLRNTVDIYFTYV